MKIWYDTEFLELGPKHPIYLLSIGMVAEDGRELYLQNLDCPFELASEWVQQNVFPHLQEFRKRQTVEGAPELDWWEPNGNSPVWQHREAIANQVAKFVQAGGEGKQELWAYFSDYDHVALCQLFGTMMDLPDKFPMYTRDVKQLCDSLGNPKLPEQGKNEHHALLDARWTKQAYEYLMEGTLNYSAAVIEKDLKGQMLTQAHLNEISSEARRAETVYQVDIVLRNVSRWGAFPNLIVDYTGELLSTLAEAFRIVRGK